MSDSMDRVLSGASWAEFCDRLNAAGEVILRPEAPATEIDRAEGWRYLSRLTRIGLEMLLECADPQFPAFYSASHATAKIGADNPDNLYLNATVDGAREYRLTGTRGTVHYLSFASRVNRYAIDGTMLETGALDAEQLVYNADGSFEIYLGGERRHANWLPMTPDTNFVIVRQTFLDRKAERPAELSIECLDATGWPAPLSAEVLDRRLQAVAAFVNGTAKTFADWSLLFRAAPNRLEPQDQQRYQRAGGDPAIYYLHGYWELAPDEALVIDTVVPDCVHWNLQLDNYWMESLDYRYQPAHVNKHSARYNTDGSVTVVIAARDVGVGNFLTTAGHHCGTLLLRWVRADHHPLPRCRVVRLDELAGSSLV